jgi:hypothetical protein
VLLRADRTLAFYPSELRPDEKDLIEVLFGPGDGSITARSATARSNEGIRFCKGHQGIASDPAALDAIVQALADASATAPAQPAAHAPQRMESSPTR